VDTFNGNFVFVPKNSESRLGWIDGKFAHAYADCDYGLRANQEGVSNLVLPGYIGTCSTNVIYVSGSRVMNLIRWFGTKRSPIKSQIRFLKRHGPWFWPIYLITPLVRIIIKGK
jgi:GT2 family glycosyltransferase